MFFGISERQRRAPRAAKDKPALDAEERPKPLDVGDEMPGRVGLELGMRPRFSAAALVEEENVVARGIEELPMDRTDPAAGPAMQKDRRLALRIAAHLPIDAMATANVEHARLARLDRRIRR